MGKLDVPEPILNKNGRPTDEEWKILRGHPGAAAKFTDSLRPWLGDWVDCSTQHHERYDGTGYPAGLTGDEISPAGRIVSIADAFDVMTAARSYKKPLPAVQTRAELLRNAGTQFDPGLVRSFLQISLPRQSRVSAWVGWLTHPPSMLPTPLVPAIQTVGKVAAATAVSAATIIAAPFTHLGPATAVVAAERNVPAVDPVEATPTTTTSTPPGGTEANDDAQTILNVLGGFIDVLANDDFGASSADTDTFTYEICSIAGSCDGATVVVTLAL